MSGCRICVDKFCAYKVPIFSSFSCEELEEVYELIQHREIKKGEVLFQDGDIVTSLVIVNEGRFKSYNYTKEGKEQIIAILKEGDSYGEMHLLKEKKFEGYLKAITDCDICTLSKEEFQRVLLQNSKMCLKVLEVVGERLAQVERLAMMLSDKDVEGKLAYIILDFAKKYGIEEEGEIIIELPITKEEMASYAGITRETLSRKLKTLTEENYILMIGRKKMKVLDMEGLKHFL
jgi:CRP/FNR family transcriptional regulator, anaerobic regulatory protein